MFLQQELWLIIVGLVVARVVQKTNGSPIAYRRIALWACTLSLIVGELGMVMQWFFPSDLFGLLLTSLAALMASKIAIGDQTAANRMRISGTPKSVQVTKRNSRSSNHKRKV